MRYAWMILTLVVGACGSKPEPSDDTAKVCVLLGSDFTFATGSSTKNDTLKCILTVDDEQVAEDSGPSQCALEYNGITFDVGGEATGATITGGYFGSDLYLWDACEEKEIE
jgi:hypothetical protein